MLEDSAITERLSDSSAEVPRILRKKCVSQRIPAHSAISSAKQCTTNKPQLPNWPIRAQSPAEPRRLGAIKHSQIQLSHPPTSTTTNAGLLSND